MAFKLRRGMVSESGPGWAVTGWDGTLLSGRWATSDEAVEQGLLGVYLLSGIDVIEVKPEPVEETKDVVQRVLDLWDRLDGWIPGGAAPQLAEALGVPVDRLLLPRNQRKGA